MSKKKRSAPLRKTYVYIGPTVPLLEKGVILTGTAEAVKAAIPDDPDVRSLVIPIEALSETMCRMRSGKNYLTEAYDNLQARYKL